MAGYNPLEKEFKVLPIRESYIKRQTITEENDVYLNDYSTGTPKNANMSHTIISDRKTNFLNKTNYTTHARTKSEQKHSTTYHMESSSREEVSLFPSNSM